MILGMSTDKSASPDLVIQVEGVHKSYRRGGSVTPALDGIDLTVRRGECLCLAGPSGSGKSTLLSILGCILSPDCGRVEILGEDITAIGPDRRVQMRRNRLGFVFQRFQLIRGLTAIHNVCVPLTLQGVSRRAAERRAATLLEAVGLAGKAQAHPQNLSAGQCQRVAVARALAADPELILADEPTASLDAANGQEAVGLLRRLTTQEGKTAVVVTHDQRIFHLMDRILWLDSGRITDEKHPSALSCRPGQGDSQ